jgi:hypothetical protein
MNFLFFDEYIFLIGKLRISATLICSKTGSKCWKLKKIAKNELFVCACALAFVNIFQSA